MNFIRSEEQFDLLLSDHADKLIVLEASLTWCRPCKGFERAYQVSLPLTCTLQTSLGGDHSCSGVIIKEIIKELVEEILEDFMTGNIVLHV